MSQTSKSNHTEQLVHLLRRINEGMDAKALQKEAVQLFPHVSSNDIAAAEKKLVEGGYSARLAGKLSVAFLLMGILQGQEANLRRRLQDHHVLRRVIAEHDLLKCFLADLEEVVEEISARDSLGETSAELMKLSHIVEHLHGMRQHIEREDDVLFPYLEKHGWETLVQVVRSDHEYFVSLVENLIRLTGAYNPSRFHVFRDRLAILSREFCALTREHITQEENVLFPIALEVIKDPLVWKRMKDVCEEIGYCGTHL